MINRNRNKMFVLRISFLLGLRLVHNAKIMIVVNLSKLIKFGAANLFIVHKNKKMKKISFVVVAFLIANFFASSIYSQKSAKIEDLDQYFEKAVEEFELPGLAIAMVKDGEVIFSKGYGFKDADEGIAMSTGSLFNIASCSKAFTAACIGKLVSEGKLDWKDKVVEYIPEFKLEDDCVTRELNIADLLCHRSGFGTFYGDLLWYGTNYTPMEVIERMYYVPMTQDFRSDWGYQNNMYLVAGEIIKRITGKTWAEYLTEEIFLPLGMVESRPASNTLTMDQDIAYPHLDGIKEDLLIMEPFPAGSIYSSVDEMSHWMLMLLNNGKWDGNEILSAATVEKMFAPHTVRELPGYLKNMGVHFYLYGLGWSLFDYSGKKIVEHDGGMPGYISKVTLVPEENFGFVILTNDMNILPGALRYKILDMFYNDNDFDWAAQYLGYKTRMNNAEEKAEKERDESRVSGTSPSLELDGYTGNYIDKMYGDAEVVMENDELVLTLLPTKELFTSPMEHWHYDTFRIKFVDDFLPYGFVTFSFDSNGKVTGFKIDLPNPDFHFFNLDFKRL